MCYRKHLEVIKRKEKNVSSDKTTLMTNMTTLITVLSNLVLRNNPAIEAAEL